MDMAQAILSKDGRNWRVGAWLLERSETVLVWSA